MFAVSTLLHPVHALQVAYDNTWYAYQTAYLEHTLDEIVFKSNCDTTLQELKVFYVEDLLTWNDEYLNRLIRARKDAQDESSRQDMILLLELYNRHQRLSNKKSWSAWKVHATKIAFHASHKALYGVDFVEISSTTSTSQTA
jgi:hypothetical protein